MCYTEAHYSMSTTVNNPEARARKNMRMRDVQRRQLFFASMSILNEVGLDGINARCGGTR